MSSQDKASRPDFEELLRQVSSSAPSAVRSAFRECRLKAHTTSLAVAETVDQAFDWVRSVLREGTGAAEFVLDQLDGLGEALGEAVTGVGGDFGLSAVEAAGALRAVGINWSTRSLYRRAAVHDGRACVYLLGDAGAGWDVIAGGALTEARGRLGEGVALLAGLAAERGVRVGLLCQAGRFWVFPRAGASDNLPGEV